MMASITAILSLKGFGLVEVRKMDSRTCEITNAIPYVGVILEETGFCVERTRDSFLVRTYCN